MIPFLPMILGGAALGALTNKKPLKGALLGGAMGAGGGLLGGAMGAGGAAGLLGNPMTAAAYGTGMGTQQTAMLAAQEAGMGGLMPSMSAMKPFMDAAGTGVQVAGALTPQDQPMAPPQLAQQDGGQTLQAIAQQPQYDAGQAAEMRRKRRQGLLGAQA